MMTRRIKSPLGSLDIFAENGALIGLNFQGENMPTSDAEAGVAEPCKEDTLVLDQTERELREYFAGKRKVFTMKLAARGTPFQMKVWQLLREIPFGETRAYVDLALSLGDKNAVRAVGGANGKNPIAIIVPCHRVIGKDGSMTGFASGVHRKEQLLALEGHSPRQGRLFD
jgi:methylated-DNA-[protein]-cysteine S-methyltransferase